MDVAHNAYPYDITLHHLLFLLHVLCVHVCLGKVCVTSRERAYQQQITGNTIYIYIQILECTRIQPLHVVYLLPPVVT